MKNIETPFNNVFQEAPNSFWLTSTENTNYQTLEQDIDVDVAIIGGGIAGITSAYLLKKNGLKVALIEANHIAAGTTAHTTAKITSLHGLIYTTLINKMGHEKAKMYGESNESAINFISDTIKANKIACDFAYRPAYVFTEQEDFIEKIKLEVKTAKDLLLPASFTNALNLPFSIKAAIKFDNQAQFHPRKYLLALAKDIPLDGSYIFENTRVLDIKQGEKCTLITNKNKKITARKVIIASHFPCFDGMGLYFTRMHSSKSYIIGIKTKEKLPDGMFINIEKPTISFRSQKIQGEEMLLVVGEDHRTGVGKNTNQHYENLIDYAKKTFKMEKLLYRWSAQDCITLDGVPYIGNLTSKTPNIFVATGFGKWGMTNGTLAAMIIKDLIVKGDNPYKELYSPSRFTPIASAKNFVVQNLDVAEKFIESKITPGAVGQDVTCTHLGCTAVWNSAEKSWDCPCHGSSFTSKGDIIEGPANKPLFHVEEEISHKN